MLLEKVRRGEEGRHGEEEERGRGGSGPNRPTRTEAEEEAEEEVRIEFVFGWRGWSNQRHSAIHWKIRAKECLFKCVSVSKADVCGCAGLGERDRG